MPRSIHFFQRGGVSHFGQFYQLVSLVPSSHVSITCCLVYEVLLTLDTSVTGKLTACVYIDVRVSQHNG